MAFPVPTGEPLTGCICLMQNYAFVLRNGLRTYSIELSPLVSVILSHHFKRSKDAALKSCLQEMQRLGMEEKIYVVLL